MKKKLVLSILLVSLFSGSAMSAVVSEEIKAAIASKERPEQETVRDKQRKPAEILSLLGAKPGMTIADLCSGTGYYTDILSRVVGGKGKVIAHNLPFVVNRYASFLNNEGAGWLARLKSEQWQKNVVKSVEELDTINLPIQLDAALMVLFYHDTVWQGVNREMMNRRIFNALKPGGVYLIVDHSAKQGSGLDDVKSLHRIEKQVVIDEITRVGFRLERDSMILAHPEDSRDYSFVRDVKTKRDQTDRMILKFIKPMDD